MNVVDWTIGVLYLARVNNVYPTVGATSRQRTFLLILVACGAQLMVVLDGLIVNVALPDIRSSLDMSASQQQWVISGYLVSFGGLLLLAARASDYLGHRRVFVTGIVIFTLASLAGGVAQDAGVLLVARFLQGIGAAALAPGSLTLLTSVFQGDLRARAISIWSATSSAAGALGVVLGGVITSSLGWRWVLLVNVPIGVALWLGSRRILPTSGDTGPRRLDAPGAVLVTVATGALVFGLSRVTEGDWESVQVIGPLLLAVAATGGLIASQKRSSDPLIPLTIFRHGNLTLANIIIAALGAVLTSAMFLLSTYEQEVLGYSALETGISLLPLSAVLTLGALASKSLLHRFGARPVILAGSLLMASGSAWFTAITDGAAFTTGILGPALLFAAGAGTIAMPCVSVATTGVAPHEAGLASGLVNTARQLGGAVGIAVLITVTSTSGDATDGYRSAFAATTVVAVAIVVLAVFLRATPRVGPPASPRESAARR